MFCCRVSNRLIWHRTGHLWHVHLCAERPVARIVEPRLYCPTIERWYICLVTYRVHTDPGKVWKSLEFNKFPRSGKSWIMTLGMEKFGKVMESVRADLENYSAWVSIVPSFGYNFACM